MANKININTEPNIPDFGMETMHGNNLVNGIVLATNSMISDSFSVEDAKEFVNRKLDILGSTDMFSKAKSKEVREAVYKELVSGKI